MQLSNTIRYKMGIHFEDEIRMIVVDGKMEQNNPVEGNDSLNVPTEDFSAAYSGGMLIVNGGAYTMNCGSAGVSPVFAALLNDYAKALGPNVTGLESDLESYLNEGVFVAALSSGTAAIHLGLLLLGVSKGDVVLVQTHTHNASVNPILY